jgi:Ca-activated chloride channel family protein
MLIMPEEVSRGDRARNPPGRPRRTAARRGAVLLSLALALAASARSGAGGAPSAPAPAPSPGAPPAAPDAGSTAPQFSEEVSVAWILVPVVVRSKNGYVDNLDRKAFDLRVGGRSVHFQDFEKRGEAPWSLVFLQDVSGSMGPGGRLEASKEAIRYFLDQARPGDEYALASFAGETTAVDVPFTESQQPLREAIDGWEAYGRTALNDAVAWLPDISGESRNVKRAAVLITDGADNASKMTADEARELVRKAELPVYVLGLESGDPFAVSPEGKKLYRYADVLNLLASMTGGHYFAIRGPDDIKEACATIADEMRYQYVLGFDTTGTGRSDWRPISVIVKKKGVRVVARRGYRGTPPAH